MSALVLAAGLGGAPSVPPVAVAAGTCGSGAASDLNGDGVRDTVVADSEAAVNGKERAGQVIVVYGGGKGTVQVHQDHDWVGGNAEPGDRFGFSLAVFDENTDGCSDLVVGDPYEDVGDFADAGSVEIVYGSAQGVGQGAASTSYHQEQERVPGVAEAGDLYGHAVAGGNADDGQPFLVVGVPGEALGAVEHAGAIHYRRGGVSVGVDQDSEGIPGAVEAEDRFGYSLAATTSYFAVGTPGESIGTQGYAGGVAVFLHTITGGVPKGLAGLDQDQPGVTGIAEQGDRFGTSLSMSEFWRDPDEVPDVALAVGTPGEAIVDVEGAGSAAMFQFTPSGSYTESVALDRGVADVEGEPSTGDAFGQRVTVAVHAEASGPGVTTSVRMAVGVPGHDAGATQDVGAVQAFRGTGIGQTESLLILLRGDGFLSGAPTGQDHLGISLSSTPDDLYVGIPYSKHSASWGGVVQVIPWETLMWGGADPVRTFQPGVDGIPGDATAFGTAAL